MEKSYVLNYLGTMNCECFLFKNGVVCAVTSQTERTTAIFLSISSHFFLSVDEYGCYRRFSTHFTPSYLRSIVFKALKFKNRFGKIFIPDWWIQRENEEKKAAQSIHDPPISYLMEVSDMDEMGEECQIVGKVLKIGYKVGEEILKIFHLPLLLPTSFISQQTDPQSDIYPNSLSSSSFSDGGWLGEYEVGEVVCSSCVDVVTPDDWKWIDEMIDKNTINQTINLSTLLLSSPILVSSSSSILSDDFNDSNDGGCCWEGVVGMVVDDERAVGIDISINNDQNDSFQFTIYTTHLHDTTLTSYSSSSSSSNQLIKDQRHVSSLNHEESLIYHHLSSLSFHLFNHPSNNSSSSSSCWDKFLLTPINTFKRDSGFKMKNECQDDEEAEKTEFDIISRQQTKSGIFVATSTPSIHFFSPYLTLISYSPEIDSYYVEWKRGRMDKEHLDEETKDFILNRFSFKRFFCMISFKIGAYIFLNNLVYLHFVPNLIR